MRIMAIERQMDTIYIPRVYAAMCKGNLNMAAVLAHLAFWYRLTPEGKTKLRFWRDGHYWLVARRHEWLERCGIVPEVFDTALKRLIEMGLVIRQVFDHDDNLNAMYLRLDYDLFAAFYWYVIDHPPYRKGRRIIFPDIADMTDTPNAGETPEDTDDALNNGGQIGESPTPESANRRLPNRQIADSRIGKSPTLSYTESPTESTTEQIHGAGASAPRRLLFEAIMILLFGISSKNHLQGIAEATKQHPDYAPRAGKIEKWLAKWLGISLKDEAATRDAAYMLQDFCRWYLAETRRRYGRPSTPPKDLNKFIDNWMAWQSALHPEDHLTIDDLLGERDVNDPGYAYEDYEIGEDDAD